MSNIDEKIEDTNENIAAQIAKAVEDYYDGADDGVYPNNSFQDILKGELAKNETLFYELNKYDQNSKLIQKIYLPVAPLNPYVSFADSQVKYGKFYKYNIFAWQMVHGTRYKYRSPASGDVKGKGAAIPALNTLFANMENAFSNLKEVVYNGFNFWEQSSIGATGEKNFKQFAKEMNQLANSLVGFKENMGTISSSAWFRKKTNAGNVYEWPEFVVDWPETTNLAVAPNEGVLSAAAAFCKVGLEMNGETRTRAEWIKNILEGKENGLSYTYDQMIQAKQVLGRIVQILDGNTNSFRGMWNSNVDPFSNSATWGELYTGMNIKSPEDPQTNLIGRIHSSMHKHMNGVQAGVGGLEPFGNGIGANWLYMHNEISIYVRGIFEQAATGKFQTEVVKVLKDLYYNFLNALECVENPPEDDDGIIKFEFEVVTEPTSKIVRVPIYTSEIYVVDNPPISPLVDINPVQGYNDRIMILFEEIVGSYLSLPIAIEPKDSQIFGRMIQRQKVEGLNTGGLLLFKTDYEKIDPDIPKEEKSKRVVTQKLHEIYGVEVFRIGPDATGKTKVPEKYTDFSGKKIALVKYQEGLSFEDTTMLPNTKYYYTFRTVDFHGNVSNPTIVYEVELVDDYGMVYLLVKPITILKITYAQHRSLSNVLRGAKNETSIHLPIDKYYEQKRTRFKKARQLVQITPSISHFQDVSEKDFFDVPPALPGVEVAKTAGADVDPNLIHKVLMLFQQWMKTQNLTQLHKKLEQSLDMFVKGKPWPSQISNGPNENPPSDLYLLLVEFIDWLGGDGGKAVTAASPAVAETIKLSIGLASTQSAEEDAEYGYEQGDVSGLGGGVIAGGGLLGGLSGLMTAEELEKDAAQEAAFKNLIEKLKENSAGASNTMSNSNSKLFGKKFKVRVSSINSGKKFDLNLTFPKEETTVKQTIDTDIQLEPTVPKELTGKARQVVTSATGITKIY